MALARKLRVGLFDRLNPQSGSAAFGLTDDDKNYAARQGLLGLAAGLLGGGGGFGNALSRGITGGLLAMNEGADSVVNDRYRQAMMQRTMAGMDRNTKVEDLSRQAVQNGQINQQAYSELASYDPERAKALREAIEGRQPRWQMGRIGDGQGGEIDVLFDPLDPSQIRTIDGQPINGGVQQSQVGLLGISPGMGATPDIGILRDAVEQQESGGNPFAVSPKGAMGPMQTMPGTLASPGFGVAPARDSSVAEQRRVGNDYLQAMVQKYGVTGGLAAYNWGPGNWEAALNSSGGDPRVALSKAPKETQDYVPSVLRRSGAQTQGQPSMGLGRRPAKAAQTREPSDLEKRIDLAKTMGASPDEIKRLVLGQAAPSKNDAIGGKALTAGTVEKMTKNAERMRNLTDLQSSFKDSYAGNLLGNFENLGGRLGNIQAYAMLPAATPGQTEWWQQYDREKNVIRNELFGAALTASEAAAFDQADINPRMDPKIIKSNLKKQRDIIERGLQRQGKVWAAQGYNRAAIDAAIGSDSADVDIPGVDDILSKYGVR